MDEVTLGGIIVASLGASTRLLALWIRARWRVRQEEVRGDALIAIAEALPAGGRLFDQRADGSCITLTVPPTRTGDHRG